MGLTNTVGRKIESRSAASLSLTSCSSQYLGYASGKLFNWIATPARKFLFLDCLF